jgi:hypothetical protein
VASFLPESLSLIALLGAASKHTQEGLFGLFCGASFVSAVLTCNGDFNAVVNQETDLD